MADEKRQCCGRVAMKLNFHRTRPCEKPATVERDGKLYCASHDPEKPKRKRRSDKLKMAMFIASLKIKAKRRKK